MTTDAHDTASPHRGAETIPASLAALALDDDRAFLAALGAGFEQLGAVQFCRELGALTNALGVQVHGRDWGNALVAMFDRIIVSQHEELWAGDVDTVGPEHPDPDRPDTSRVDTR